MVGTRIDYLRPCGFIAKIQCGLMSRYIGIVREDHEAVTCFTHIYLKSILKNIPESKS